MAKPKRPRDMNELAVHIGKIATGQIEDPEVVAPTPLQERAAKGGRARAANLSRKERITIARKGGKALARKRSR